MCAGISGRCVMSNVLTARDANRGGCAQICRWDFDLKDEQKKPIKGEKEFTFCAKDLSLQKYIPDMIECGIDSFKIEGRMRSIYYIATIVDIYRRIIDEYCNDKENFKYNVEYENILRKCANRDSVAQFFDGTNDESCGYYNGRVEISNQDFLGLVLDYDEKNEMAQIEMRNYFKKGDQAVVFGPEIEPFEFEITEIYDENETLIDVVRHPKQIVKIKLPKKVYKNNLIRLKS